MCNRLGKKHRQYVGADGLLRLKQEKCERNPKRRLWDTYLVQILLTNTNLRDVFWNPQHDTAEGISKELKPAKQKLYTKLERYENRARCGK